MQMVEDGDCVLIFHSIHRVMKAEKALLKKGLEILLIPVPRTLSADCGMAIRFQGALVDLVREVLDDEKLRSAELWLMRNRRFERIDHE